MYTGGKWEIDDCGNISSNNRAIASCMVHSSNSDGGKTRKENMYNGKHIVKCVNSHSDLMKACKEAWELIQWQKDNKQRYDAEVEIQLEEAIKKGKLK